MDHFHGRYEAPGSILPLENENKKKKKNFFSTQFGSRPMGRAQHRDIPSSPREGVADCKTGIMRGKGFPRESPSDDPT